MAVDLGYFRCHCIANGTDVTARSWRAGCVHFESGYFKYSGAGRHFLTPPPLHFTSKQMPLEASPPAKRRVLGDLGNMVVPAGYMLVKTVSGDVHGKFQRRSCPRLLTPAPPLALPRHQAKRPAEE